MDIIKKIKEYFSKTNKILKDKSLLDKILFWICIAIIAFLIILLGSYIGWIDVIITLSFSYLLNFVKECLHELDKKQ